MQLRLCLQGAGDTLLITQLHLTTTRSTLAGLDTAHNPRPSMTSALPPAIVERKTGLGLSQVELRALEQTRLRLQNLTHSLASFKHDLQMNNPLPNP